MVERVLMAIDENPAQACLDFGSGEFRLPPADRVGAIGLIANQKSGEPFENLNGPGDERYDWIKPAALI